MEEKLKNIKYEIGEISKDDYGSSYKVSIRVPMSLGFIERMKFSSKTSSISERFTRLKLMPEERFDCTRESLPFFTETEAGNEDPGTSFEFEWSFIFTPATEPS